jgi:AraC-like DNA-binding protein
MPKCRPKFARPAWCWHRLPSSPYLVRSSTAGAVAGVLFRPGGLQAFLDLRVAQLGNVPQPARKAWGDGVDAWPQRLSSSPGAEATLRALESLLVDRLGAMQTAARSMQAAARLLAHCAGEGTVSEAAATLGRTPRQFTDAFRAATGYTPKVFERLSRFTRALRLMRHRSTLSGTEVAMDCDYFDQAHFVRDFRALAGLTPTAYRELRGGHHSTCLFTRTRQLMVSLQWRSEAAAQRVEVRCLPQAAARS